MPDVDRALFPQLRNALWTKFHTAEKLLPAHRGSAVGPARFLKEETRLEIAVDGVGRVGRVGSVHQEPAFEQVGSPGFEQHGIGDDPVSQASLDLMAGEVTGLAGTVPHLREAEAVGAIRQEKRAVGDEGIPDRARRDLEAYRR